MNIEQLLLHDIKTVGNRTENKLVYVRNKNLHAILNRFDKEEHRLEMVAKFRGITFINDAKSASINTAYYSFETLKQNVVWITGGKDENTNYDDIMPFVIEKVKAIICIGDDNKNIIHKFSAAVQCIYERTQMEDAVSTAFYLAEPNETVLLSLACECDEKYGNYKNLGMAFKNAIAQL
ncbi:MAG: hypothetical protein RBS13_00065 [Bacteroidales bacterium]|jgi:UDP-N-acetylmuramoylalanine--D-glutamate ligase|nr:hypothetical protein [Bacteroidales bacterium]